MALRHWLQLALTEGIGPILSRRIIDRAGSAEAACAADVRLLCEIEGIGTAKAGKIHRAMREAAGEVDAELARAGDQGIRIFSSDDDEYPFLLKAIPDPPVVLYVNGTLEPRDLNAVAIVGSRKCTYYGREQAERFAALLGGAGFAVVSGGARGVDSSAHRGAMADPRGRTIAVLGSGLDVPYPPENAGLFEQIAKRGAVVSEFPFGTPPNKENFPRRNRVVSGISRGVLVVEADIRSGALITARLAVEDHNRPVFALPGRVDNPQSAGPHKLIREGAVLVESIEDIVSELTPVPHSSSVGEMLFDPYVEQAKPPDTGKSSAPPPLPAEATLPSLSEPQQRILRVLGSDSANVDRLVERTGLPASAILREITFLTLQGRVKRIDGQTYRRTQPRGQA